MPRYIVQHDYKSHVAHHSAGQVVEMDADLGDWFNRDSPGVLKLIEERPPEPEPVETRAIEVPPKDRMVRKGKTRKGN